MSLKNVSLTSLTKLLALNTRMIRAKYLTFVGLKKPLFKIFVFYILFRYLSIFISFNSEYVRIQNCIINKLKKFNVCDESHSETTQEFMESVMGNKHY